MNINSTLLVVLEQHFVKKGDKYYTDVQCDRAFWDRYLSVFNHVIVCARVRSASASGETENLLLSSRPEVNFIDLPDFRGAMGPIKNLNSIKKTLKKGIKQADAVIFRIPSPISMVTYPIVKRSNKPWALEMMMNPRTAYSKDSMSHPLQPIIQWFVTKQTKRACMDANGVSYVTEHVLQDEYPCKALLYPQDEKYFTSSYSTINLQENNFSLLQRKENSPKTIFLAHTGKMTDDRKGHIIFLKTISELRYRGIDARGILIGDGPRRKYFEQVAANLKIEKYCDFTGWASGFEEVQSRLQRAYFFIFPTKSEGLPRAVIEAMASGLLCIGHNIDGMSELLDESCLVNDNNYKKYADKIIYYINNWKEAEKERKKQFLISHKYDGKVLAEARTIFYNKLLEVSKNE